MEKTKETVRQERKFLRLCSKPYKEMVQGKRKMTVNDFNRICYAITRLDLFDYFIYFTFRFKELHQRSMAEEDKRNAQNEILYSHRDNLYANMDKWQMWLREFWEQMPLESQKRRYKEIFWIENDFRKYADIV